MNETDNTVAGKLAQWGIPFAARYAGEQTKWENQIVDAWRVSIGGFETDFYQGLGHRKAARPMPSGIKGDRYAMQQWQKLNVKPIAPTAAGVLYCLISDGEAVNSCFADWASDLGYDTDSRKALATYEACCAIGQELRKVFTPAQRAELAELLQGY